MGFPGSLAGKKSACNTGDPGSIPGFRKIPWRRHRLPTRFLGFPGGSDGKESNCNVGDLGSIPGFGRSPGGHGNPLQYSCLENPHGQKILAGYSPWGCKESDMTEQLSTAQYRASSTTLNISGKSGYPCLVPDLTGKAFGLHH